MYHRNLKQSDATLPFDESWALISWILFFVARVIGISSQVVFCAIVPFHSFITWIGGHILQFSNFLNSFSLRLNNWNVITPFIIVAMLGSGVCSIEMWHGLYFDKSFLFFSASIAFCVSIFSCFFLLLRASQNSRRVIREVIVLYLWYEVAWPLESILWGIENEVCCRICAKRALHPFLDTSYVHTG